MVYVSERTVFVGATGGSRWIGTPLFSDFNIHECNLMLFDPLVLNQYWNNKEMERLSGHGSKELPSSLKRRWEIAFASILSWVEEGNTLVVVVRELPPIELLLSRDKKISENPSDWEPFCRVTLKRKSGNLVEPTAPFVEEFSPFQRSFSYRHVLTGSGLTPLYTTSNVHPRNQETVAGFFRRARGVIVFAPQPDQWSSAFLDAITRLPDKRGASLDNLPDWVGRFQNKEEREALDRVAGARSDLEEAQRRIEQEGVSIRDLKRNKVLYAGTDASLVEETANALREFGLNVIEGPHPRADLLIWDGARLAAAEVKGVEGPAREADVRQVNTWTAEVNRTLAEGPDDRRGDPVLIQYADRLAELGIDVSAPVADVECSGLMIIATFRKIPLDDRSAASFPHPVAMLIKRFDVGALTGLDLYCLCEEARSNPGRKEKIARELLTFRGVMPPRDWRQFITAA